MAIKHVPLNDVPHARPVWLVYGHEAFPQILCCQILEAPGYLAIWGLSNRTRSPKGFITLGQNVKTFLAGHPLVEWYLEQGDALARLGELTTYPKVK